MFGIVVLFSVIVNHIILSTNHSSNTGFARITVIIPQICANIVLGFGSRLSELIEFLVQLLGIAVGFVVCLIIHYHIETGFTSFTVNSIVRLPYAQKVFDELPI